jgi:peptide chain release factor
MSAALIRLSFTGLRRQSHHPQCLLHPSTLRSFTTSTPYEANFLPPRPTLPDSDLHHVFLKGSGPGGQKINKTNSAVQLTHLPTGIVVKSQATRSRSQNHKIAKQILAEKIEHIEKGDQSRLAKKVERMSAKRRSRQKKARRKYRALEEGKNGEDEASGGEEELDGAAVGQGAGGTVIVGEDLHKRGERSGQDEHKAQPKRVASEAHWPDKQDMKASHQHQ